MGKSKVYFTDFRTRLGVSQGAKLQKLIRKAGIYRRVYDLQTEGLRLSDGEVTA